MENNLAIFNSIATPKEVIPLSDNVKYDNYEVLNMKQKIKSLTDL